MTRYTRKSVGVTALAIAAAFAASLFVAAPGAWADIIFTPGNNPQPDENNIFFGAKETGSPILGQVGQPVGPAVQFESLTGQELLQNAKGQASIENNAGGTLNSIGVTLPGLLFADFIMNLQDLNGSAHIDVRDNLGDISQFDLPGGPGNNFLTITIDPVQFAAGIRIAGVFVNAADGFDVFKQPRVSGVCDPAIQGCGLVPIQTPEPASLAMLGGALIGFGFLRRRKRS
jgi:hypothetical protein